MLDKDILRELDEASIGMMLAEERLRAVCRRVCEADPITGTPVRMTKAIGDAPAGPPQKSATGPSRRGGRRSSVRKKAGGTADEKKTGDTKDYRRKVTCRVCMKVGPSRVVDGKRYPAEHANPNSGRPCPGSDQSVGAATRMGRCPRCGLEVAARNAKGIFTPADHKDPDGRNCVAMP